MRCDILKDAVEYLCYEERRKENESGVACSDIAARHTPRYMVSLSWDQFLDRSIHGLSKLLPQTRQRRQIS